MAFLAAAACAPATPPIAPTRINLPLQSENLRLIVVGDLHTHGPEKVAAAIKRVHQEKAADAMIVVGDNFDPCGVTSVDDPQWEHIARNLSPLGIPMFPVLGNHDYGNPKTRMAMTVICGRPDEDAQIAASRRVPNWRFPARNYVVSTPIADIVMVDTTPVAMNRDRPVLGSATAARVKEFAAQQLSATAKGKWRIVAGHHNIRYSGKQRWKSASTRRHMDAFNDVITAHGAEIYLCGHQHQLELIVPDKRQDGPVMLISGAAWRPKNDDALTAEIDDDAHFLSNRVGFATLEVDRQSLRVVFYDGVGMPMSNVISLQRKRE